MPSDLRKPLLGRQKKSAGINRRFSVILVLSTLAALSIGGLSIYAALSPGNLQKTSPGQGVSPKLAEQTAAKDGPGNAASEDTAGLQPQSGKSGANISRETMSDGNVVSVYSPRPRDGTGPVLMSGQTYGQDPRMATRPNEELVEETAFGQLPVVGADGLRPMEQYARPWSGTRGVRIAIVVGGLGLSQTGSQKAIRELPPEVTLGFAASGNSLQRWMQEARRQGHEILLQIPLEPFGYPGTNPGPDTLLASDPAKINLDRLHRSMAKITNYTGIMNYLGGRFLAEQAALEPVMRDIGKRGLLFLDDGSSAQSLSGGIAKAISAPQGFADVLLDGEVTEASVLRKLDELERIARRNGQAIGVASAFDESVAAISKWSREAGGRGIEIVGVSALVSGQAGQ
ncbi:divergent polysaccharide deacetylase family protein [uncultured Agrobacterium sp.]|uniref:divergent polysaccharide deacetylase family protein n=2 Tax=Agrobacterium TaxID=357 RepID=UPI0025FF5BDE|nr:divergent polysaccharide deacetylase family protein [uncultured Agrobacterium sp.]